VSRNWEKTKVADVDIRERLKIAFEHGAISPEPLGRAIKELGPGVRSKVLETFLEKSLDEKSFGELCEPRWPEDSSAQSPSLWPA
jgi:hypothetical protein